MGNKKTLIDLGNTVFCPAEIAGDAPPTAAWNKKTRQLETVPDFGTVFIGLDNVVCEEARAELFDAAVGDGAVFTAPDGWTWAHIAKAMGAFTSVSRARKNGWEDNPEEGFTFRKVRLNRVRGELLVVKITENSPWAASTEDFDHD